MLEIRQAELNDAITIATYNRAMALETEQLVLDEATSGRGVQRVLENDTLGRYYLALRNQQTVACLLITYEWSDWRSAWFWWIQSVYVQPQARREGVFRALYAHLRELAKTTPEVCGLRLYVERDNQRAQSTYRSQGMSETHYKLFEESF